MGVFFTADLHLDHHNILRYDGRPFADLVEMREEMKRRWNAVVKPHDTVYVLGDVAFRHNPGVLPWLLEVNGILHLVPGNHDNVNKLRPFFTEVHPLLIQINACGRHFLAGHFPLASWMARRGSGWINVHGHCHGNAPRLYGRVDVGTMNWAYAPVAVEEVIEAAKIGADHDGH